MTATCFVSIGILSDDGAVTANRMKAVTLDLADSSEVIYSKLVGAIQPMMDIVAADFVKRIKLVAVISDDSQ